MSEHHPLWKGLKVTLIVIGVLCAIIMATLHFLPKTEFARSTIVSLAEGALEGQLQVGGLSGSLLTSLEVTDVQLLDIDGQRIATTDSLKADLAWTALLSREVELELSADSLEFFLVRDEEGTINVTTLTVDDQKPSTESPVAVDLKLDVSNLLFAWRDLQGEEDSPRFDGVPDAEALRGWASRYETPEEFASGVPRTAALFDGELEGRIFIARDSTTDIEISSGTGSAVADGMSGLRPLDLQQFVMRIASEGDQTSIAASVGVLKLQDWLLVEEFGLEIDPARIGDSKLSLHKLEAYQDLLKRAAPSLQPKTGLVASAGMAPRNQFTEVVADVRPIDGDGQLRATARLKDWQQMGPTTEWSVALVADRMKFSSVFGAFAPFHHGTVFASIDGQGFAPGNLTGAGRIGIRDARVERYRISAAFSDFRIDDGEIRTERTLFESPYIAAALRGHFSTNDGDFGLELRAESSDDVAEVGQRLFGRKMETRADIRADFAGSLDLDAEDPMAMLQRVDGNAEWSIEDFTAEDVNIKKTDGRVELSVEPRGEERRVRLDLDASGRSIRSSSMSLASFDVSTDARSTVSVPSLDARNALGGLRTTVDLEIDRFAWDGTQVGAADVLLKVRPREGRLAYDVSASVEDTTLAGVDVQDFGARLDGTVNLGRKMTWPGAVRGFTSKGDLALRGMKLQGDSAGSLDAKLDIGGPLKDLRGTVDLSATNLAFAGYDFKTLGANVAFTGEREFRIDAQAEQTLGEPKNLGIFIRGRYHEDLTDYTVLELRFTSAGDAWNMSDGFSIDTRSGTLRFDDVTLSRGDQRVHVDGVYKQGASQDLRVDIEGLKIGELDDQFGLKGLDPLKGWLNGAVELGGTARNPTARFELRLIDFYYQEYGPFEIFLQGKYDEERLDLETVQVEGYGAQLLDGHASLPIKIQTTGTFEIQTGREMDVLLEAKDVEIDRFHDVATPLKEWGAYGEFGYRLKVKGSLEDPVLDVRMNGQELYARRVASGKEFEVGPARLDVTLDYLSPSNPRGGFDAAASLSFHDEPPLKLVAELDAAVDDWLVAYLDGEEVDWGSRFETVPFTFSATSKNFDLRNLRLGMLREADAEGLLTLDIQGEGTLRKPSVSLNVELDDFGWNRYRDVVVDLKSNIDTETVDIEQFELGWDADHILSASGSIPAPFDAMFGDQDLGSLPIDFAAELAPLPIAKFSAIDYSFASVRGQLGGYVELQGTLREPVVDARFSAINIEMSDGTLGTIAAEVSYAEGQADGEMTVCTGPREMLVGTTMLPVELDFVKLFEGETLQVAGDVSASLKGERVYLARLVPGRIFEDYVTGVEGTMAVDLRVDGTMDEPNLEGDLKVEHGKFFLASFSRGFEDVRLDFVAEPDEFRLREFHVGDRNGFAKASGTMKVDGFKPGRVDGKASLKDFGMSGFTEMPMFLTADMEVGGDLGTDGPTEAKATISNLEVVIPDTGTRQTHPMTLDPDIVVVRQESSSQLDEMLDFGDSAEESPQTRAQFNVVIERDSWIRHPQGQVELMGDIDVELIGSSVILAGEIETVRGTADVLGKRFDIEQGLISFTGADPPNPRLQIEAVYRLDRSVTTAIGQPTTGDPRAIVRVTGRADNPQIRFLSDPEMPESDIITTLITGRPPSQQDVGETQGTGLAAGAATGLAAGLIEERLSTVLPVEFDVFRIETGDSGFADPRVEVGKYIFEDVFFSIEYKIGAEPNENTSEFNLEYRFAPRWIFEFTAGNLGTGEADVFWEIPNEFFRNLFGGG